MKSARTLVMSAAASLIVAGAAAQEPSPLSRAQTELLELMSLLQVASAACEAKVDTQLLGLVARKENLTLKSEPEKKVIANAMADARLRFSPQKRGVECLVLFDEYGPKGSRMAGLLRRR